MTGYRGEFLASLNGLIDKRLTARGIDEDSSPVAIQAALDQVQNEVNTELAGLTPGFTFTFDGTSITVDMRKECVK